MVDPGRNIYPKTEVLERLARILRFDASQLLCVLLHEFAQSPDHSLPVTTQQPSPAPVVESSLGSLHRPVYILAVGVRRLGNLFTSGRVFDGCRLAARRCRSTCRRSNFSMFS